MIARLRKTRTFSLFPLGAGATEGRHFPDPLCSQLTHPVLALDAESVQYGLGKCYLLGFQTKICSLILFLPPVKKLFILPQALVFSLIFDLFLSLEPRQGRGLLFTEPAWGSGQATPK